MLEPIFTLFFRWRYPVSTPKDLSEDLGVSLSLLLASPSLVSALTSPTLSTSRLCRYMTREMAEKRFAHAIKKEKFPQYSLFSYSFKEGWIEFLLYFDQESRLRRLYVKHKNLAQQHELLLSTPTGLFG